MAEFVALGRGEIVNPALMEECAVNCDIEYRMNATEKAKCYTACGFTADAGYKLPSVPVTSTVGIKQVTVDIGKFKRQAAVQGGIVGLIVGILGTLAVKKFL